MQASTLTFVRLSGTSENWRRTSRSFTCPTGQVKKWLSYLLKVIFYDKMCCFIIFTDMNFVNNYFKGFKNIGFHWSTLSLIITVNQETFRTYTWINKTICISKQIIFWRHFGKGMQCGNVVREMLTELFVRRYFQQNELLIYFFLISVT